MKTIIIDDNKNNRELLHTLLRGYSPEIIITGNANSIEDAFQLITKEPPDLIFLDMELKDGNGLDLLNRVKNDFSTIITTSYKEYAFDAYQKQVVDYLIKPIHIESLLLAIEKVRKLRSKKFATKTEYKGIVAIPNKLDLNFVDEKDLLWIEAEGKYTTVNTGSRSIQSTKSLKDFENTLGPDFLRVHHSFIVNIKHCVSFDKAEHCITLSTNQKIPVSLRKKDDFLSVFLHL
jgi:two-component system, LytTR family, response regulator